MKLPLAALTALAVFSQLAWSQASPVSSVECADETDDAARLRCYDAQTARQRAAAAAAKRSVAAAALPTPAAPETHAVTPTAAVEPRVASSSVARVLPTDPNFGLQGQALRSAQERASPDKGSDRKQRAALVARVSSVSQRPGYKMSLVLDNGQVWEQAEQSSDALIAPNDPVTIRPGMLGSFYLTDVSHRTVRFRRVQ
jgi:hypothetical protein